MSTVATGPKKIKTERFPWNKKMGEFFVTPAKIYSWVDVGRKNTRQWIEE